MINVRYLPMAILFSVRDIRGGGNKKIVLLTRS